MNRNANVTQTGLPSQKKATPGRLSPASGIKGKDIAVEFNPSQVFSALLSIGSLEVPPFDFFRLFTSGFFRHVWVLKSGTIEERRVSVNQQISLDAWIEADDR